MGGKSRGHQGPNATNEAEDDKDDDEEEENEVFINIGNTNRKKECCGS